MNNDDLRLNDKWTIRHVAPFPDDAQYSCGQKARFASEKQGASVSFARWMFHRTVGMKRVFIDF